MKVRAISLCALISGLVTCGACDNESEIRVYSVNVADAQPPTDKTSTTQVPATQPVPPATRESHHDGAGNLHWKLPPGWQRVPGEKPMRVATFETTQGERLEISLSRFPGDTGGLLANVNRWRQQVGLAPLTEANLAAELRAVDAGSLSGHTMRLRGETQHMLGAILMPADKSESWFIKATGDPAVIDAHQASFEAFVRSIHSDSASH